MADRKNRVKKVIKKRHINMQVSNANYTKIKNSEYPYSNYDKNIEKIISNDLYTGTSIKPPKNNYNINEPKTKIYKCNDSYTGKIMQSSKYTDSHNDTNMKTSKYNHFQPGANKSILNKNTNNIKASVDMKKELGKYQENISSFEFNKNNVNLIDQNTSGLKQRQIKENINPSNYDIINNAYNLQPFAELYNNKCFSKKSDSVCNRITFNNRLGKFKKESRFTNGAIGLANTGNTCYLNSALQNLKNIYPLTLRLLENYDNFNQQGFTYRYCELIANLINQKHCQYYTPKYEFFSNLNKFAPIFRLGEQNDSNFCILYILNILEKETKNTNHSNQMRKHRQLSNEEEEKLNKFLNKFYTKRNSFIIDLFYGFQEDIYRCMNCNYINYTFQAFSVLNLSIMNQNNEQIPTLERAIKYYEFKYYHKDENDFKCPICNKSCMTTQSIIISFPKILIINFKRIGERNFYSHNVEAPTTLELYNYQYQLTGFIKHIGGPNFGHNIAICKNFFDDNWYVYDDSRVIRLDNSPYMKKKDEPDTKGGFLFFYKKTDEEINKETSIGKDTIINKSSELRQY